MVRIRSAIGFGISSPALGYDDYDASVNGKIVLAGSVQFEAVFVDPKEIVDNGRYERYMAQVSGGSESITYFTSLAFQGQNASIAPSPSPHSRRASPKRNQAAARLGRAASAR